jgi:hypothetical protein
MSREAIAELLADARSLRALLFQRDPSALSLARYELDHAIADYGSSVPIERVVHCADLWTLVSSDQLYGLSIMIKDGQTVFSLFPVLRSVMEHSAWVTWVLDDEVTARRRAARASLAVLRNQEELQKAASRMGGKISPTRQDAKARYERMRADIGTEFGSLQLDPLQIDDEALPRPSKVIEAFGARWGDSREWCGMYDYLSGTANHPSLNANEYFDLADPAHPVARIQDDLLNRLLRAVLVPYLKSLEYFCSYMGWDATRLDGYIDRVNDTLGVVLRSPDEPGQAPSDQQSAQ